MNFCANKYNSREHEDSLPTQQPNVPSYFVFTYIQDVRKRNGNLIVSQIRKSFIYIFFKLCQMIRYELTNI